ncbi:ABC transporter substrate-binding protein [Vibrio sp. SCSIO 43136]|uniref:ABC transporter substrate-binding protein n=1 Tax=Vibrio sp. SCSIO 43136 TaxID=2819101 RepID=UPI002074F25B|nr:ABC transporter substrate-binding protein [Vibrio sp. SCSIO 43136]USD67072.1 ABC transporter substrate-binding protein [Vibrio sp. SCSIO 43136]
MNHSIKFWNGNKSPIRQHHELELTQALLGKHYTIIEDKTDYSSAKQEGEIFLNGADLLVTVKGNTKFHGYDHIVLDQPLAQGILGKRLLVATQEKSMHLSQLTHLDQLKAFRSGIPATWADADLFRHNGCKVVEQGSLETMFQDLVNDECDYFALGANEVQSLLKQYASHKQELAIVPNVMLRYPMNLVYYIHPEQGEIANQLSQSVNQEVITSIYNKHYGDIEKSLGLSARYTIVMENPNQ